jgi:hypothetical protein
MLYLLLLLLLIQKKKIIIELRSFFATRSVQKLASQQTHASDSYSVTTKVRVPISNVLLSFNLSIQVMFFLNYHVSLLY